MSPPGKRTDLEPNTDGEAPLEGGPSALDVLVVEARRHLDVRAPDDHARTQDVLGEMDWSRLESRVMASVELENSSRVRDELTKTSRARLLRAGSVALVGAAAIAATVAIHVRNREHEVSFVEHAPSRADKTTNDVHASALRKTEGPGEVRVGGVVAAQGSVVRPGDTIDAEGARGVFERPHKVTWLIEQDTSQPPTRVKVKSADEALILGLEHGVIEAQVVPVPSGEAFAVDIATEQSLVRVAVHGTHLRVARAGNRVVVDLTEGVVAIGVPPRSGVTVGTTVTAPAHVELDATDLATLRIDHAAASVRTAIPLHDGAVEGARLDTSAETESVTSTAKAPIAKTTTTHETMPATTKAEPSKPLLPARDAIAAGVRECVAARGRSGEVHVTVSSSLRLNVSPEGVVESAQFSPPLSPDVQSCAAQVIYKVKLEETGLVTIPIELSY